MHERAALLRMRHRYTGKQDDVRTVFLNAANHIFRILGLYGSIFHER